MGGGSFGNPDAVAFDKARDESMHKFWVEYFQLFLTNFEMSSQLKEIGAARYRKIFVGIGRHGLKFAESVKAGIFSNEHGCDQLRYILSGFCGKILLFREDPKVPGFVGAN